MAAPTEGHIEGYFIPKVTKRTQKKNWPLPPFVVEEGKRIEAQVSAQKMVENKEVILPKLSGDNWFKISEVKSIDTSVIGDLVTSGHNVSSDLKMAFQPLISDISHDKVIKNVTSDKGHEEVSDKFKGSDIHSEPMGDSDKASFILESDSDNISEIVSDSDNVTVTASDQVSDHRVNSTVSDRDLDSDSGVFLEQVIERAPVELSDSDRVSMTPSDRLIIYNGESKVNDIFTVSSVIDKGGEGSVMEYPVSSDSDNLVFALEVTSEKPGEVARAELSLVNGDRFDNAYDRISDSDSRNVSERGSMTGSEAVRAGAPVTNYVAPSVSVPVHVIISDSVPKNTVSDRVTNRTVSFVSGPIQVSSKSDFVPHIVVDNQVLVVKEDKVSDKQVNSDSSHSRDVAEQNVAGGTGGTSDSRSISEVKLNAPIIGEIVITFPDNQGSSDSSDRAKSDASDTTVTNHNSLSYFSFDFNIQIGDIKVVIADHSSNVGDQNGDHVNPVIHVQDEPNEQKVVTDTRDVDWDRMATMAVNSTTMVGDVPVTVSDPARVKYYDPYEHRHEQTHVGDEERRRPYRVHHGESVRDEGRAYYAAKEKEAELMEKVALWSVAGAVLGKSSIGLRQFIRNCNDFV